MCEEMISIRLTPGLSLLNRDTGSSELSCDGRDRETCSGTFSSDDVGGSVDIVLCPFSVLERQTSTPISEERLKGKSEREDKAGEGRKHEKKNGKKKRFRIPSPEST